ncbi:MAG: GLPGLI family protein [Bacteroidota bacterium]
MKSKFFLFALLLPLFSIAQQNEGEVVYTETIKMNIDLPDDMDEKMRAMIPTSQSFTKSLIFNEKESLYTDWEAGENEDLEISHEEDGMDFQMVMKRPENIYYADLANQSIVNKQEFFGRMFLITGEATAYPWKLTGEQKKINDFICQKATCTHKEQNITAWFTPQIPLSTGPNGYGGLPGLVLEVDINDGERTITPLEINLKAIEKGKIEKPTKGKKVTKEEFTKIRDEKMKEMNAETGGSGVIKMIVTDDVRNN